MTYLFIGSAMVLWVYSQSVCVCVVYLTTYMYTFSLGRSQTERVYCRLSKRIALETSLLGPTTNCKVSKRSFSAPAQDLRAQRCIRLPNETGQQPPQNSRFGS
jgi:hypothetical protein